MQLVKNERAGLFHLSHSGESVSVNNEMNDH